VDVLNEISGEVHECRSMLEEKVRSLTTVEEVQDLRDSLARALDAARDLAENTLRLLLKTQSSRVSTSSSRG
jgi:hypothetical protein